MESNPFVELAALETLGVKRPQAEDTVEMTFGHVVALAYLRLIIPLRGSEQTKRSTAVPHWTG